MHRVADPKWVRIAISNCFDQARQLLANLRSAHPGYESQSARLTLWVEFFNQFNHIRHLSCRTELYSNRVSNSRKKVDVRVVNLTSALAHPDEVTASEIRGSGSRIDSGHRTLVVEEQTLVRGVKLGGSELLKVSAAGRHKVDRAINFACHGNVALVGRIVSESLIPLVHRTKVGKTTLRKCADQIKSRCSSVICLQDSLRVSGT